MERDDLSTGGSLPQSSTTGTNFGGAGIGGVAGADAGGTLAGDPGTPQEIPPGTIGMGGTAGETTADTGIKDRARDMAGGARERLADVGTRVRERTGNLKDSVANALESGAGKLRTTRTGDVVGAGAGGTGGTVALSGDGRVAEVGDRVAGGMEATADWLRDADLDSLKTGIEQQVKQHPGRTLLIALGLGYLLGKAFKR